MKAYQVPKGPPHLAGAEGAGGVEWVRKGLSRGSSDPMIEASWQSGECKGRAAIDGARHCHTHSHTYTHTHTHTHIHTHVYAHTARPGDIYQSLGSLKGKEKRLGR